MEVTAFSDEELSVIFAVLQKADPMTLVTQIQSAIAKIKAYADAKTAVQVAQASEVPTDG